MPGSFQRVFVSGKEPLPSGGKLVVASLIEAESFDGAAFTNAMSVDVEEYFQVSALETQISRKEWESYPGRIEQNMNRVFEMFGEAGAKATFFTLGWIARKYPELIRKMVSEGHEIASHGFHHERVSAQSPDQFRKDVSRTKKTLEDISGQEVLGYRAPSFSIDTNTLWAHDVLQEEGYCYSSSIYPIVHDHYGMALAPRVPFRFKKNGILEIPLTTARIFDRNWPAAGGGYFRLLPLWYSSWALRRVNQRENIPAVFYFHPWEIDPDQPRVRGISAITRFRHYVNLSRFESRLEKLLKDFSWGRMDQVYLKALAGS